MSTYSIPTGDPWSLIWILGASFGNLAGVNLFWQVDVCIVSPATLADGVGGKGNTSCEKDKYPIQLRIVTNIDFAVLFMLVIYWGYYSDHLFYQE